MKFEFDPTERFISTYIEVQVGPVTELVEAALDTGAAVTVLPTAAIPPNADWSNTPGEMVTASGTTRVRRVKVASLRALGWEVRDVSVVVHDLPAELGVRALLGRDFFLGSVLEIDFVNGYIEVRVETEKTKYTTPSE